MLPFLAECAPVRLFKRACASLVENIDFEIHFYVLNRR